MGKRKIVNLENSVWLTDQLGKFERVHVEELKILNHGAVAHLASVTVTEKGRVCTVHAQLANAVPLAAYYSVPMRQRLLMAILWDTMQIAMDCEKLGLRMENLSWSWDTIFMDTVNHSIHMVYWPIVRLEKPQTSMQDFYRGLQDAVCGSGLHKKLVQMYCDFFAMHEHFDLPAFREMLQQFLDFWLQNRKEQNQKAEEKKSRQQKKAVVRPAASFVDAWLEREDGSQRIVLDDDLVVIGRDGSQCHQTISGDPGVSRRHAKIVGREDGYYLIDLESANGTYYNSERLPPRKMVLLRDGDRVAFAKTKFIFHQNQSNKTVHIHQFQRREL